MAGAVVAQGTHECWVGGEGKGSLSPSPLRLFPFLQGGQGSLGWVGRVGFDPPAPPGHSSLRGPPRFSLILSSALCLTSPCTSTRPSPWLVSPPGTSCAPPTWGRCPENAALEPSGRQETRGTPRQLLPEPGVSLPAGSRSRSSPCCHPSASGGSDVPGSRHGPRQAARTRCRQPACCLRFPKSTVSFPRGGSPEVPRGHLRSGTRLFLTSAPSQRPRHFPARMRPFVGRYPAWVQPLDTRILPP